MYQRSERDLSLKQQLGSAANNQNQPSLQGLSVQGLCMGRIVSID